MKYPTLRRTHLLIALLALSLPLGGISIFAPPIGHAQSTPSDPDDRTDSQDSVDQILAGHSAHGSAFNEGPRQQAYLMEGTGKVSFPVTTSHPEVQAFINQGLGQFHGFWFLEAERSFRHAAALDPDCAMAYWGAALANAENRESRKRGAGFIEEAVKRKDQVTRRERMYIEALAAYFEDESKKSKQRSDAYMRALEKIALEFPDDLEAKALIALQYFWGQQSGVKVQSYLSADALMQQIFQQAPLHPTHHYCIHLWDYFRPEAALKSAALCGPSAPAIAHMWHMPGHIYSRLHRYEDAVDSQEASARVDHAHMMRDRVMPDEIHNFAHNNEWLIRNLIFVGRASDAIDLAKNMIELPRHPKYNMSDDRGSAYYGRRRLQHALVQFQLWDELIQHCHSSYLPSPKKEADQIERLRHLGTAYWMTGQNQKGEQILKTLTDMRVAADKRADVPATQQQKKADAESIQTTETTQDEEVDKPSKESFSLWPRRRQRSNTRNLRKAIETLEGFKLLADNNYSKAYQKLKQAGTVDKSYLAEVRFLSGQVDESIQDLRRVVKRQKQQTIPLARLTYVLSQAGRDAEAAEALEQLRTASSSFELGLPVFSRLAPLAQKLGYPADWRKSRVLADDLGQRPDLPSLGPFRWLPAAAPSWRLQDSNGQTVSLKQYQNKPVILLFYLGYECLHCAEQLHLFGKRLSEFEQAGISVLAISSDNHEGLCKSIEDYDGDMPIRLLSDEPLEVFKRYRAHDDFESVPLHGTFLIDNCGLIRWQDIGYEPFMDATFLLEESQRLLSVEVAPPEPAHETVAEHRADELPLVFESDFEQGMEPWQLSDAQAWKVTSVPKRGNVLSQFEKKSRYRPPHRSPLHLALLKEVLVGDFQLDVDVRSTHKDYGHRDVCVFFGYQNPAKFYYVHLGKQMDPRANQIFLVDRADRTKISTTTSSGTPWDDRWHHVRIKRCTKSGSILVYFDDMEKPVMTASDKTFASGRVGLGSFDDTADWDNFQLRGLRVNGEQQKLKQAK